MTEVPEAAVEAAARQMQDDYWGAIWEDLTSYARSCWTHKARAALEAAAPHMLAGAWEEGREADDYSVSIGFEKNPYRPTP